MFKVYEMVVDRKKYIGCTGETITTRMSKHRDAATRFDRPLYQAMNKAGLFNATVTILHQFSDRKRALATEARLIKQLKPSLNVRLK